MIYTQLEEESLRGFLRVEAPLVTYARTLRAEETDPSKKDDNGDKDPFAGIDFDDLPEEIANQLKEAKSEFSNIAKAKAEAEKAAKTNGELASRFQSEADARLAILQKHNLTDGGKPNQDVEEKLLDKLTKAFVAEGIEEKIARVHAKLQLAAQEQLRPELLKELGQALSPALAVVSDMHSNRLLQEAQLPKNDPDGHFQIPEVAEIVQESLGLLVKNGATVTVETIQNLKNMAVGQIYANPEKRDKLMSGKTEKPTMRLNTGGMTLGGGGNPHLPNIDTSKGPKAANDDTARAMAATLASMTRGIPQKGGKK